MIFTIIGLPLVHHNVGNLRTTNLKMYFKMSEEVGGFVEILGMSGKVKLLSNTRPSIQLQELL